MTTTEIKTETRSFMSAEDLLNHWQGHRRLTRRVIEAFPEEKLFDYSIGGMRPFGTMIKEIIDISGPGIKGVATGQWENTGGFNEHSTAELKSKADLLSLYDQGTAEINTYLPTISAEQFRETIKVFGLYEGVALDSILYFIDNEIHHRAQGFVYLRSLDVEPPAFYDRG